MAITGESPDFCPRVPILMLFAARWIGRDYAAFASDHRVLVEANLRCAEEFDFDQLSAISDPYRETQGFGGRIEYLPDSPPRCTAPLEHERDWRRLPAPDPWRAERMRDRLQAVRALRAADTRRSVMGWVEGPAAEAADLRGVTNFLMDLIEDEAYAGALMDFCTETAIRFATAQIEAGADTIGIGDAIASQVSADHYERLILPREQTLLKAIRSAGAWTRLHICGNITHLLPGIASLGMDILDLDHMVDLRCAREAVGPRVVLAGNLDPVEGVMRSTPQAIRAAIARARDAAGAPFMVAAGCEIPAGTPPQNLRALCEPLSWPPAG